MNTTEKLQERMKGINYFITEHEKNEMLKNNHREDFEKMNAYLVGYREAIKSMLEE